MLFLSTLLNHTCDTRFLFFLLLRLLPQSFRPPTRLGIVFLIFQMRSSIDVNRLFCWWLGDPNLPLLFVFVVFTIFLCHVFPFKTPCWRWYQENIQLREKVTPYFYRHPPICYPSLSLIPLCLLFAPRCGFFFPTTIFFLNL